MIERIFSTSNIFRLSESESDCVEVILDSPERTNSPNDDGIKKKRKKKHKHKKHSDKVGHVKKHKKHKRKRSSSFTSDTDVKPAKMEKEDSSPELSDKSARYTPEPIQPKNTDSKNNVNSVVNGKSYTGTKEPEKLVPSTDVNAVVENITKGLSLEHSLEIVSSESEDVEPAEECDSEDIDVAVIEEDMNLEELMKQKELLQARLGEYLSDGSEEVEKKDEKKEDSDEVILLDDSSNSDGTPHKQKLEILDRRIIVSKKEHSNYSREEKRKRSRSPYDRRSRERDRSYDLKDYKKSRDKHKRDKIHEHRDKYKYREKSRSRSRDRLRRDVRKDRERYRSRERREKEYSRGRDRSRERSRYDDRRSDRDRSRDRHRRRDDYRDKARDKKDNADKYKDSLSEGLGKLSSDSEIDENIDIKEEEDEETIIERRRKQREELLKVFLSFKNYINYNFVCTFNIVKFSETRSCQ